MPHRTNTPQQPVNCQDPTLKQKAATPHSQNTPISHHFKTIQRTFQDHQPAINQKAPQKMKSPQYLQKHAQHRLQDHQKSHTSSNQLEPIHTLHLLGNHHFYRHHQHQRDYPATQTTNNTLQDHQHPATVIQPSQDLHRPTTGLTTNTFQDHHHHHLDTNTHPAFSGPANYSYYLQPHIPGPYTAFPPYLHQNFITGPYQPTPPLPLPAPYQQISGHFQQGILCSNHITTTATTLHRMKIEIRNQKKHRFL